MRYLHESAVAQFFVKFFERPSRLLDQGLDLVPVSTVMEQDADNA
eukprot:CAMPEP_0179447448 /NCGR_PEP_ID=MMETSP0799-20121207/31295_1 /TAXON_ID=46947 /ORGANISM="Geminigera cryophila, Strain CCMP2564" /LENGTH=44 /DNA_ID= /DNA_START= /DNA_END= /DNA_ORIENTATION=